MPSFVHTTVRSPCIGEARVKRIVEAVLRHLSHSHASVAVHFVGLRRMQRLNRVYRGLDRPTDVLSFSLREGDRAGKALGAEEWGDVFLCVPYLTKQARRFGVSYEEECIRMLIHGLLHLAGFDHDTRGRAKKMFQHQERLLSRIL